jgi:hypothetical protein
MCGKPQRIIAASRRDRKSFTPAAEKGIGAMIGPQWRRLKEESIGSFV